MGNQLGSIPLTTSVPYDSEVVKLTGTQTINGKKTFKQTVKSEHSYSFETVTDTDWSVAPENPIFYSPLRLVYKKNGQDTYTLGPYFSFSRTATGMSIGMNMTDYNGNYSSALSVFREDNGTKGLRYNGDLVKGSAFAKVGMPNMTNRVDLTLPSEQGGNVVPSSNYNGWVQLTASTPSTNTSESVISFTYTGTNIGVQSSSILPSSPVRIMLPVIKGQSISVKWTNCTVSSFQFIKANAEVQ